MPGPHSGISLRKSSGIAMLTGMMTGMLTLLSCSIGLAQHHGHHGHHGHHSGGFSGGGMSSGHHHHHFGGGFGGFYGGSSFYGGGLSGRGFYGNSLYGSGLYGNSLYGSGLYGSSYGIGIRSYSSPNYYSTPRYYGNSYPNVQSYGVYSAPIRVTPRMSSYPPGYSAGAVVPQQSFPTPVYSAPATRSTSTGNPLDGELRPGMVLPDGAVVISVGPLRTPGTSTPPPAPAN